MNGREEATGAGEEPNEEEDAMLSAAAEKGYRMDLQLLHRNRAAATESALRRAVKEQKKGNRELAETFLDLAEATGLGQQIAKKYKTEWGWK